MADVPRIEQSSPVSAVILPPFENIEVVEGQDFTATISITNKAELDTDSVQPFDVEFTKLGGGTWDIRSSNFAYGNEGIKINVPAASVDFSGRISLSRILVHSASGTRRIWPY